MLQLNTAYHVQLPPDLHRKDAVIKLHAKGEKPGAHHVKVTRFANGDVAMRCNVSTDSRLAGTSVQIGMSGVQSVQFRQEGNQIVACLTNALQTQYRRFPRQFRGVR